MDTQAMQEMVEKLASAISNEKREQALEIAQSFEAYLEAPTADVPEHLTGPLHVIIAQALLLPGGTSSDNTQFRAQAHLRTALNHELGSLRKLALMLLADAMTRSPVPKSVFDIAQALSAAHEAIDVHQEAADESVLAVLAYRAGQLYWHRLKLTGDQFDADRSRQWLRMAAKLYAEQGRLREKGDALAFLGMLIVSHGEDPLLSPAEREQAIEHACRYLQHSLDLVQADSQPALWAMHNAELGKALAKRCSGALWTRISNALEHFDVALNVYERQGDLEKASRIALDITQLMNSLPGPWTEKIVERQEFYLVQAMRLAKVAIDFQTAVAAKVILANLTMHAHNVSGGRISQELLLQAQAFAEEIASLPRTPDDSNAPTLCAMLAGNLLLAQESAPAAKRLKLAEIWLHRALLSADQDGTENLKPQIMRQRAIALCRLVYECQEQQTYPAALVALQDAINISSVTDRVSARLNLASMIQYACSNGWADVSELEHAATSVRDAYSEAMQVNDSYLAATCKEHLHTIAVLSTALHCKDELLEQVDVGPSPMGGTPYIPIPAKLFVQFRKVEPVKDSAATERSYLALLDIREKNVHGSKVMTMCREGAFTVSGSVLLPCVHCDTVIDVRLPWLRDVSMTGISGLDLPDGGTSTSVCAACGSRIVWQAPFILHHPKFSSKTLFVYTAEVDERTQAAQVLNMLQTIDNAINVGILMVPLAGLAALDMISDDVALDIRRRAAVGGLALAILMRSSYGLHQIATDFGGVFENIRNIDEAFLTTMLPPDFPAVTEPSVIQQLAKDMTHFLDRTHTDGWPNAIRMFEAKTAKMLDYGRNSQVAIDLASNNDARRDFLLSWLHSSPDHSAERDETLRETLRGGGQERFQQLLASDDALNNSEYRQHLIGQVAEYERMISDLITKDRENDTHPAAKNVLRRRLRDGQPFVLVLRGFNIDAPKRDIDPSHAPFVISKGDPRIGWREISTPFTDNGVVNLIATTLKKRVAAFTVEDRRDTFHRPNLPELRVPNADWRQLVFCLMHEATAIIAILEPGAASLEDELRGIVSMRLAHKAILIKLAPKPANPSPLETRGLSSKLTQTAALHENQNGFPHVLTEEIISKSPELLLSILSSIEDEAMSALQMARI